jgi:hypothetical protein
MIKKEMYIIEITRCNNPLQWYNRLIGHRFLCSSTKFEGFNTKIFGAKFFIPERDTKIITPVLVKGKPYTSEGIMEALDPGWQWCGHNDLEAMLEMEIPAHDTSHSKLEQSRQISKASEVL